MKRFLLEIVKNMPGKPKLTDRQAKVLLNIPEGWFRPTDLHCEIPGKGAVCRQLWKKGYLDRESETVCWLPGGRQIVKITYRLAPQGSEAKVEKEVKANG